MGAYGGRLRGAAGLVTDICRPELIIVKSNVGNCRHKPALRETASVRPYFPDHLGLRLARNAEIPSRASSELNAVMKPLFSASIPSSRSAFAETFFTCSTAT